MECLRDYIGFRGCTPETAGSVLFVNDLEGFSMGALQNAANEERKTWLKVWDVAQTRALKRFRIELTKAFQPRYRLKTMTRTTDLLRRININATSPAQPVYRGFSAQLRIQRQNFVPSVLQVIAFSSLSLYLSTVPVSPIEIKIFNLDEYHPIENPIMQEIDSFTLATANMQQGWNQIVFERTYDAYRLAIAYDATEITSVGQSIPTVAYDSFISNASSVFGPGCSGWIRGFETLDLSGTGQYLEGSDFFGLSAVFSVACRFDSFVCSNRDVFSYPLWNLMGAELMYSMRYSEEINRFNTSDAKEAEVLMNDYNSEFEKSLKLACDGIDLEVSDHCLSCNEKVRFVESHP